MSSDQLKKQLLAQKLMRSVRNKQKSAKSSESDQKLDGSKQSHSSNDKNSRTSKVNETELTKRAIEEIQRDTLRASKLAEEIGPSGWRVQTKRTNKRFLSNTMKSVLSHNQRTSLKHATESKRKFQELTKRPPKFGARLHSFQSTDERMKKSNQTDSNS